MRWTGAVVDFAQATPWTRASFAAIGGTLFAIGYVFSPLHLCAWFAVVPFLLAVEGVRTREAYLYGFIFGIVAFSLGASWIVTFLEMFKGYGSVKATTVAGLFWVYHAQVPALVALSYSFIRQRTGVTDLLVFPVCLAAVFSLVPMLFTMQLAVSQAPFLTAIQGVAVTGPWGLDAVIGLSAVAAARMMAGGVKPRAALIASAVVLAWFGYGVIAKHYWSSVQVQGKVVSVGLVQSNQAPVRGRPQTTPGFIRALPPEMEMTERLAAGGADLIVWPEARYKGYVDDPYVAAAFRRQIARHRAHIIFQDIGNATANGRRLYNRAIFIDADGRQVGEHRKAKLIPFGEAIPFADRVPAARRLGNQFFEGLYRDTVPGSGPTRFSAKSIAGGELELVPLICFESVFAPYAARGVGSGEGSRTILVAMINDGWFGATAAPFQHRASSSLRAVENRAPMIVAMNNGPSAVYMPNGELLFATALGEAGGYLIDVPVADRAGSTLFTRYPYLFLTILNGTFFLLMLVALVPCGRRLWSRGRLSEAPGFVAGLLR